MKQIEDNSVSGLEQIVIAMLFICIVPLGMILHLCVSTADYIRGRKRREARQADAGSLSETQRRPELVEETRSNFYPPQAARDLTESVKN